MSSWAKNNLSDTEFESFRGLADTAENINLLQKIISKTSNSKVDATAEVKPAHTKEELRQMLVDPRYASNEKGYRKEVDQKYMQYLQSRA